MSYAASQLELSVIIVSYNTAAYLRRCLLSLERYRPRLSFEVIVVDNASTDGSADMVATDFPHVRLIRHSTNDGYGVALNRGVSGTEGRLLMFLNPDVEVTDGSVDHLCRFATAHPRAGVVGPRLELADGTPQASAKHFRSAWRLILEASRLPLLLSTRMRGRLLLGTYFDQSSDRRVSWVSGACHVIPRTVWEDIGCLTEDTFCGFDDYDYCFRAHVRGYETWIDAHSRMTHHCSVAVKGRWTDWEVEQVAIHNTYVVLESHWARWRVKSLMMAEIGTYSIEWARLKFSSRRRRAEQEYSNRLARRIALLAALLTGRQQPIRRFSAANAEG